MGKKEDDFDITLLITKENDTNLLFINFKFGERDSCNSYTENKKRSDAKIYDSNNEKKQVI